MLENFSKRVGRAIFQARLEAGQRGAASIDVNSLVIGLIIEDQDPKSLELNDQHPDVKRLRQMEPRPMAVLFARECAIPREPFFLPEVAANLLAKLNVFLPRSNGIPPNVEMHTSPEFERALEAAEHIRETFHHTSVQPLHLLAAIFGEPCEATRMLQEAGITEEKVRQILGSSAKEG